MVLPFLIPAIATVAGAGATIFGADKAADAQMAAADKSIAAQLAMFAQTQKNIAPTIKAGNKSVNNLQKGLKEGGEYEQSRGLQPIDTKAEELYGLGTTPIAFNPLATGSDQIRSLGTTPVDYKMIQAGGDKMLKTSAEAPEFAPIEMTQEQLEATPGYQFTLQQGLKAVQNSAAARGLGSSGMAQRGAAEYTTGLADTTWQNVYNQLAQERAARYTAKATDLERVMAGYERSYALKSAERASRFNFAHTNRLTAMNALGQAYGLDSAERGAQFTAAAANKATAMGAIQDRYNLLNTERTTDFNAYQTDLQNRYNRAYQMAALGSGAAQGTGATGAIVGGNIGSTMVGAGNAGAAAIMAGANALGGAANQLGGYYFADQMANQNQLY
jgi:hypothetical protein